METVGVLERVESGTVKQRRVKAKQADEVRQHHTYYRLSRDGDHLLRFLDEHEGRLNVLRHLPDGQRVLERLAREGPDAPRPTAETLEMAFEHARHLYRALRQVGLVSEHRGEPEGRGGRDGAETDSSADTYYEVTDAGERSLGALES